MEHEIDERVMIFQWNVGRGQMRKSKTYIQLNFQSEGTRFTCAHLRTHTMNINININSRQKTVCMALTAVSHRFSTI